MATKLVNLLVKEVSLVDRPANPGAVVLLTKRDDASEGEIDKKLTIWQGADGSITYQHAPAKPADASDGKKPPKKKGKLSKAASSVLNRAVEALAKSFDSLFEVSEADRQVLLAQTMNEFETFVQAEMPAGDEDGAPGSDADTTDNPGGILKGNDDMTMTKEQGDALQKSLDETKAELAKASTEIAFLKMSSEHQEFAKDFDAEKKAAWAKKDPKARDAEVADCAKRAAEQIPDSVRKALADGEVAKAESEKLAKRVADLEAKDAREAITKRVSELGLSAEYVDVLTKARKGDVEALTKLEDQIKALGKQVKESALFKEFGSVQTATGDAYGQLQAKAEELRKHDAKLTQEQAFSKAYTDPANKALVAEYKREKSSVAA